MKKTTLLNSEISYVISQMGHTDSLCICDAGLPISEKTKRIDLALTKKIPTFLQVLDAVLSEQTVQSIVLAKEIQTENPKIYQAIIERLDVPIEWVSHEEFKKRTEGAKAVIRSGECTPYANILLISGVSF